jgi:hypothetical protein
MITCKMSNLHPPQPRTFSPAAVDTVGPLLVLAYSEHQRMMHRISGYCIISLKVKGSRGAL